MQCLLCNTENPDKVAFCQVCSGPLGDATAEARYLLPIGSLLQNGRYTVGKVLGRGGFGITYLGSDVEKRRPVALKEFFPDGSTRSGTQVVQPNYLTNEEYSRFIEQFMEEANLLRQFDHPSIVRVFDTFCDNQTAYMVMEYHPVANLGDLLDKTTLDPPVACRYIEQIGSALDALHGKGYLHRDVKPSNILILSDGRAVLIDFGTAREYTAGKTRRMTMMLTPGYAPLEQYTERARRGPYTDVYSLAGTLYHMLTGELPVAATDRAVGLPLPSARELNPQVSVRLSDAVQFGLNMEVGRRPQSAREFTAVLRAAIEEADPVPQRSDETPTLRVEPPASPAPEGYPTPGPDASLRLTGHSALVHSVAISPSSRWVASGGWDGTVRLWDSVTGKDCWMARLQTSAAWVFSVAFDMQERYLAAGSEDRSLRVWDIQGGTQRHVIDQPSQVLSVAFSPDGRRLVSGSADGSIRVYDAETARPQLVLSEHNDKVWSIAFSPDGFLLASASEDRTVRLWEPSAGRQLYQITPAAVRARSVCFSPDGQHLLAAFDDSATIWETFTAREVVRFPHPAHVSCAVFSPDGRYIATAADDQTVRIFNSASGQLFETLEPHGGKVATLAWSSGGELLVSGGSDRTLRIWRMRETLGAEQQLPFPTPSMLPPVVGRNAVPATRDRATILFKGHRAPVQAVTFAADGQHLITGSEDHTVRMWSIERGEETLCLSSGDDVVNCVSVSRQNGFLASGSEDHSVRVWQLPAGTEVATLRTDSPVRSISLSASGRWLAAGYGDNFVRVWDVKTGAVKDLRGHDEIVTCVAFSPDEKHLLSSSEDRTVLIWNAQKGELVGRVTGHTSPVWAVAFSPDGRSLFSASSDRSVRMWDLAHQRAQKKYNGHGAQVRALAIPLEGTWMASGGDDRTIRFWDIASARELHRLDLRSGVSSLACSPQGTHVAWTCHEPTARLLKVDKYVSPSFVARV